MANRTIELLPPFAGQFPSKGTLPALASTKYYKGTLIVRDANGRAALPPAATVAGLDAAGVSVATFDNTLGANDAMNVEVDYGVHGFAFSGTALTKASEGKKAYVADNQTLSTDISGDAGTHNRGRAGIITEFVNATFAYVMIAPQVTGAI